MAMTKEQQGLFAKLTRLQQRIALGVIEGKAQRQAYLDAGGKAKDIDVAASQALSLPKMKAFIESIQAAPANTAVMTREEAMARLSDIARTSAPDLVEIVSKRSVGRSRKTTQQVLLRDDALSDPAKRAAIAELTQVKDGIKIKTHSPVQAIQQLARMQGWEAAQKFDLSGHIITTEVKLTPAQREMLDQVLEESV
jgi:phage terminase small subunit